MARKALVEKCKRTPKFARASAEPLPALRSSACFPPEVRHLPDLLP